MKKYILIIVLGICTISGYAQNSVDGKLPKWLIEMGGSTEVADTAKKENSIISSNSINIEGTFTDIIFNAVAPALNIVKQQYRLKKGGDFFGRNNMPHFGESFSLAVKVAGGTILQNEVLYPWVNDNNYHDLSDSDKYIPVLYHSYKRSVTGGEYEKINLELDTPYVQQIGKDSLLYSLSDKKRDFGLEIDTESGEKNGYMLWVYEAEGKCDYVVEALKLNASVDSTVIPMKPSNLSSLLGGVYVIPVNERPGTVSFYLVGVASTCNNKDWSLKLMTQESPNINITK